MDEWSVLRRAVAELDNVESAIEYDFGWPIEKTLNDLREHVPRLIKEHEELRVMTKALMSAVEEWKRQEPGGLVVADGSDIRRLYQDDPPPF